MRQQKQKGEKTMNATTQGVEREAIVTTSVNSQVDRLLASLVENWNRHDIMAYVAPFKQDCDFVNVLGRHLRGRAILEKELAWLHTSIFRNSKLRILETNARLLSGDVVVCPLHWEMRGHESLPGHAFAETRTGVLTLVLQRDGERWVIAAAQNTDFVALPGL
jgi:uncharacterized protein (TIGR02246 family)